MEKKRKRTASKRAPRQTPRQRGAKKNHKSSLLKRGPKRMPRLNGNGRRKEDKIPPLKKGDIRVIPIGGVEEVGKNMTAIEHDGDILIIDCGFQFKEEDTPGIDFILPNTKYLEDRKKNIRAMLITHGHLDHIGGIPYLMEKLGNPPIYTRQFGALQILKRQEEFPHLPALDIKVIKGTERIRFGSLQAKFFPVDHSIPDSMGIIVETPHGDIVMTGDLKLDSINGVPTKEEFQTYSIFEKRNVLLLTLDSTNVERPGFSLSESVVIKNIHDIIKNVKGRLIIAAFASQIDRLLAFIEYANKFNKKIVVEGRSMKTNIEIVKKLGLIKSLKDIISVKEMDKYPLDRILVLSTGGQGEEYSALVRMANKTHRHIKLTKNDTVLMSSSIIPGNETAITKLKDNIYRHVDNVITYLDSDVHASGHAYRGEMEWVHKKIPYKFFMPVHGHHYMLRMHAQLAQGLGTKPENVVVPDNGSIVEIQDKGKKIVKLKEKAPSSTIMVDGFAVGDTQEMVIRDRKVLADDGIFLIVASIDPRTGALRKSPDIIARGFVYLRESQELLAQTRLIIKKSIEKNTKGMNPINFDYLKDALTDDVRRFLFQKTAKSPMVIPVIIGI